MIYNKIEELIGNTPIVKLSSASTGLNNTDVYVKLEYLNPFGSIKDRTALGILSGYDKSGKSLIESSSGNTAKALQVFATRNGTNLTTVTNRIKVEEVERLLRFMGTEIIQLPGRSECPDPKEEGNALSEIARMTNENPGKYFHTSQYTNISNTLIHKNTTAQELFQDLPEIDYFITGVGTAGSSGGIIEFIKENTLSTKVLGVVADPVDFLPGIRTMAELYETKLFDINNYLEIIDVNSLDSLKALRSLVQKDGILAGPTTGANYATSIKYLKQHDVLRRDGKKQIAVFIACDRIESYMSYIVARMPNLFNNNARTDIFCISIGKEQKDALEKEPSQSTLGWIKDSNVRIVDTRGVKPFSKFHIEGSICYPEDYLREVLAHETPFTETTLFVCPSGDRSILYAKLLRDRGIEAYSLKGGLLGWRQSGMPLERPSTI